MIEEIVQEVYEKVSKIEDKGELPTYIPELASVDPDHFGVYLSTLDGSNFGAGEYDKRFSIQSIAKVLSLTLAYRLQGDRIWQRVGVEPSGTAFNSLIQLEADDGIPRNPFLNAGSIVISDILISNLDDPKTDFLDFVRGITDNSSLDYNSKIAESEREHGYRNIAHCNFVKSLGNIDNEPDEVLDFYFNLCCLEMSCRELSEVFLFLANNGDGVDHDRSILTEAESKRINALMQTCGFYDESGEFAFKVGLPGKSGVGGGIIAIHPDQYSIAVWSPKLNKKGNSFLGMRFLEEFTTKTQHSIF